MLYFIYYIYSTILIGNTGDFMRKFIINSNDSGQRVDKFLTKAVPNMPKSVLYKSIRLKKIKLNKKRCDISTKLIEGDILELYINDEFFENDTEYKLSFLQASKELDIIYEDENIIIVNKDIGIAVHNDNDKSTETLINKIKHYLYDKGEYLPQSENSFSPAVCNRLDKNTCGLVISAKNAQSLRDMNEIIRNREIHKKYLCLTVSTPPKNEDTLLSYLHKNNELNKVTISDVAISGYKEIVTKYKILKNMNKLTLLEIELITGRTHQIRAHMAHIGCNLLGDNKYGIQSINKKYGVHHQALCAYSLDFNIKNQCSLSYLNCKSFKLPYEKIWFVKKSF